MGIFTGITNSFIIAKDRMQHGEAGAVLNSVQKGLTGLARAWDAAAYATGLISMDELKKKGKEFTDNAKNMFTDIKDVLKLTVKLAKDDSNSEFGKTLDKFKEGAGAVKSKMSRGKESLLSKLKLGNEKVDNYLEASGSTKLKAAKDKIGEKVSAAKDKVKGTMANVSEGLAKRAEEAKANKVARDAEVKAKAEEKRIEKEAKAAKKKEDKKVKAEKQAEEKKQEDEKKIGQKSRFAKTMDKMRERSDKINNWRKNRAEKKSDKKEGWIGKILAGLMTVGGIIVSKLLSGITGIMGTVAGTILKGIGWLGKGLIPMWARILGKVTKLSAIAGWASKGVAKVASTVAWTAARGVAMGAATVLAPVLVPVAIGVGVAAAAYGLYKGAKYLGRNSASSLDVWRFMQYGLGPSQKDNYHLLKQTEELLSNYTELKADTGRYTLKNLDKDANVALGEIFEIGNDPADKARISLLRKWLTVRVVPVYLAHLNAANIAKKDTKISDVDSLSPDEKMVYLKAVSVPPATYEMKVTCIKNYEDITVTKQEVDEKFAALESELKSKASAPPKIATPTAPVKPPATAPQATTAPVTTPPKIATPAPPLATAPTGKTPGAKQEERMDGGEKETAGAKARDSVTIKADTGPTAKGPLTVGDKSMAGINVGPKAKIEGIDPNVWSLFGGMAAEYYKLTGKKITLNQGFRTREDQERIARENPGKAARPGNSSHEFGLALDIASVDANALDQMGLMKKYGFTRPVGKETWHIEPIGVSMALASGDKDRIKHDHAFRSAAIASSPGRGGGGYGKDKSAPSVGRNYSIQKQIFAMGSDVKLSTEPPKEETFATGPVATSMPSMASKTKAPSQGDSASKVSSQVKGTEVAKSQNPETSTTPSEKQPAKVYPSTVVKPMVTKAVQTKEPESYGQSASSNQLASSQVTNVMNEQLTVLNKIANLLNSIDMKFDPKVLAETLASKTASTSQPSSKPPGTISTSGVSMARVGR